MANLTTDQKVSEVINKFLVLGIRTDEDTLNKMGYVLSRLIQDQHKETVHRCYETINSQSGEEVSNLNPRAVDVGLRWAQHSISQIELED